MTLRCLNQPFAERGWPGSHQHLPPTPTEYIFKIVYQGPPALVIDAVPAEFEVVEANIPSGSRLSVDGPLWVHNDSTLKPQARVVENIPAQYHR
jgi:hypothetical protein